MRSIHLYDSPALYDRIVPPGLCEAFYRRIARSTEGPILELACGTGRLTIPLALDGHEVVALDASRCMLKAASEKAEVRGADIAFVHGDMKDFHLRRQFKLVIVSCNSLAHLTSDEALDRCLGSIARHLAPDGRLAFDVMNPDLGELARQDRGRTGFPFGCASEVRREMIAYDPVAQVQRVRWRVPIPPGEELVARMELRVFFPREIGPRLRLSRLKLVARYGDFEGGPLTGASSNQVCLAGRA